MMYKSLLSIQRATSLLGHSDSKENFVIIKLEPVPHSCCCLRHWPSVWPEVNKHISPAGPMMNEGNVLIKGDDFEFVLECHESGPEIVVYLTASILLIKSVVDLLIAFVKALQKAHHEAPARLKITRRQIIGKEVKAEFLYELDLPLSEDIADALKARVQKALKNAITSKPSRKKDADRRRLPLALPSSRGKKKIKKERG